MSETHDLDPQKIRKKLNRKLKKLDVRADFIRSSEEICRLQTAMLANFQRWNFPQRKWAKLKQCSETHCGRTATCSGACYYGGRRDYLHHVVEAAEVISGQSLPTYTATLVYSRDAVAVGQLYKFAVNAIRQRLRRTFAKIEREAGLIYAVGSIEASLEGSASKAFWQVHIHLIIATYCPEERLKELLKPPKDKANGAGVPPSRPLVVDKVTNLGNAVSYAMKDEPRQRIPDVGSRGESKPRKITLATGPERAEYDRWLNRFGHNRIVIRGMKRIHGILTAVRPQKRGQKIRKK